MFCQNCGVQSDNSQKFCGGCGVELNNQKPTKTEVKEYKEKSNTKKKSSHYLLWWQIDESELQEQVSKYEKLTITKSARGAGVLCLLFSATLTTLMILFLNWDPGAYFDVALFLFLAIFMYKGHKWSMIAAMLLWTAEKGYMLLDSSQSHVNPIVSIIWWAIFMHYFWLAYKVEKEKDAISYQ